MALRARPRRRVRRDPEVARALILAAATELFAAHGPDAVGLKDVARAAGVSHALVIHYFGSFGGLVEAALEERSARVRQEMQALLAADEPVEPGRLLDRLWEAAKDPVTARLLAWALLSGRIESASFFPRRIKGLKLVTDALEARARGRGRKLARVDLEDAVATAVAFTFGYALARGAVAGSLGREPSDADDARVRRRLLDFVEAQLKG